MTELIQFRVVFLGVNELARGRTVQVEAVDISAASVLARGLALCREYVIVPESRYGKGDLWGPAPRRGRRRPPAGARPSLGGTPLDHMQVGLVPGDAESSKSSLDVGELHE